MSKTPITIEALEKEGFTIREVPGMEFSTVEVIGNIHDNPDLLQP